MTLTSRPETQHSRDRVSHLTAPGELVRGDRESFVGRYSCQRSGSRVCTPGLTVGGGRT